MNATEPRYDVLPPWFLAFCDRRDGIRYHLDRPWLDGDGYIYATDGRVAARVRADLIGERVEPSGPDRRVPRRIGRHVFGDGVKGSGIGWEPEPLELPEVGPYLRTCPACEGHPTEPRQVPCDCCGDWSSGDDDDDEECPYCRDTGTITVTECLECDNTGEVEDWSPVEIARDGRPTIRLAVAVIRRALDAGGRIYARAGVDHSDEHGPSDPSVRLRFVAGERDEFEGRIMPMRRIDP